MRLVVISGRSGSGKTTALQVLEDLGYYCVDNLPIGLLPQLLEKISEENSTTIDRIAVGIDARNAPSELTRFESVLKTIQERNIDCDIFYLDARDDTLYKRFSSTRRKHPLSSDNRSLSEAISLENDLLDSIASNANFHVDTSTLTVHELRSLVKNSVSENSKSMAILFQSFGFKHGVPTDADFVFDVRCLPNPYWETHLRQFNGLDEPIQEFLGSQKDVTKMLNDISGFLSSWISSFEENNRSYMTVAIGCTGGQHRSVYMAENLARIFSDSLDNIQVRHRELF